MKKLLPFLPNTLCAALVLLFVSCSKSGDTGPAGPIGPAGPAGSAGSAGSAGAAGPAGTANVIYSAWTDVTYGAITDTTNGVVDTLAWVADIPVPKLVDSILSRGEIKVYMNWGSAANADVVPLPLFDPLYFNPAVIINVDFFLNIISLISNYNVGTATSAGVKFRQYRYILIPGGTAGRPAPGGKTVDWNNYKEVQKYLGLTD